MIKVARVHAYGGPDAISIDELPKPVPAAGQVLVAAAYAGVNFFDTQLRSGLYRRNPLPVSLGNEGAGTIEAIGPEVSGFAPGDRVCWIMAPGSYATHVVVPVARLVKLPGNLAPEIAAAGIFQGMTAHYLAGSVFPLGPGMTCVVHSAAGGVGQLLVQIAKLKGAKVVGTVSNDAKAAAARAAGADHVINYTRGPFAPDVKALTGGRGADVVYDAVGLETYEQSLASLRPRGMLALYGEASGLVPPLDVRSLVFQGSCVLTRTGLEHFIATRDEYLGRANDILGWLADGKIRVLAHQTFPLDRAPDAHRALEGRNSIGKVLLRP